MSKRILSLLLAVFLLLAAAPPAVMASGERDAALDSALNYYPDSDLTFTTYICRGGDIEIVTEGGRTYAVLMAADEEQGDNTTYIKLRVVAKKDDRLMFDHASCLDYMDGATVGFGYMNGSTYVELYSNEEESGDGVYDGDTVQEWQTGVFDIPEDGEYEFMWRIDANSTASRFAIDDVLLYPAMTVDRAINASDSALRWTNDPAYPWRPAFNAGRVCMKSGAISHNGSTSLVSNSVMLRGGDVFSADIATDSETGYDKLNVYYTLTSDPSPAETLIQTYSGTGGQWSNHLSWPVPSDGLYSFRLEYKKDNNVSSGSDSVFVCSTFARQMSITGAAAPGFENEIEFDTYNTPPYYMFAPDWYEGEIVLASTNQSVHSSTAVLLFSAELMAGEAIAFDYSLDSEDKYDYLSLLRADQETELFTCKADTNGFETYSFYAEETGEYAFILTYKKDSSVNQGRDSAIVKNFRIIPDDLSAALRRDDDPYLEARRGVNGGLIELIDDGERYYAQGSGFDTYAIVSTSGYQNQNEYVIFDYKVTGENAKLEFWAYDGRENEFVADGSDEWHTYYYRIPASGSTPIDWIFEPGGDGTVCVDNVYIGNIGIDFSEALNDPDTDSVATPIYIDNFIGHCDPLEPRGVTKYVFADPEAGSSAAFEWEVAAAEGDYYEFLFKFFDEDGEPNGSCFRVYRDGVEEGEFFDTDVGSGWWKLTMTFTGAGVHIFRIEFDSEGNLGGDGFAVARVKLESLGVSLDEALNTEGGTLHFTVPDEGAFIPAYDAATDRYVGHAMYAYDPDSEVDLVCSFESASETNGWSFRDGDGDGSSCFCGDPNSYTGFGAAYGTMAMLSGPLFTEGIVTPGGVDNWAVTPAFTVPEGGISGSWITLMYASASASYPEKLEIWVLPEGDPEDGVLLETLTAVEGGWQNVGLSLMDYAGQTIAVGFRHCTEANAFGLLIDDVHIECEAPYYAKVSFTREMRSFDRIRFDMRVDAFGHDELQGNIFVAVYQDDVNVANYDGQSCFDYYGEDWVNWDIYVPDNEGTHTYTVVFTWLESSEPDFRMLVDNIEVYQVYSPISWIGLNGYQPPAAGDLAGDHIPSVPDDASYYIEDAVWVDGDENQLAYTDRFTAGESYTLWLAVVPHYGNYFEDEVVLWAQNDPNAEIYYLTEDRAVIRFTQVTLPSLSVPGDVNCDGVVTASDISALFAYVMNAGALSPEALANADVNGDGNVDATDASLLAQMVFGN